MDADGLRDLFAPFAPVLVRAMFGGHGIYADGLCFAVQVKGEVFLKGDGETQAAFETAGCARWFYESPGKTTHMPYWRMPASAFDDADDLVRWCRLACGAALRRASKNPKKPARRAQ